jgi:radical SAM superfamily enzyme YgiQ (UPF0313 family)
MKSKALLLWPEFTYSFWSYRETNRMVGAKALTPPLGLLTVAALLPADWELRLVDMNVRELREDDWAFADLVMISAMIVQEEAVLELVREAEGRGKTVVVGGPYVTSVPERVLAAGGDYVVQGEGESAVPRLLAAMAKGKTGLVTSGERPDLRYSPIPRYDLVNLNDYGSATLQTSRGCPFDCEFCDIVNLFGRTPRYKSPEQVTREMEAIYRQGKRGGVFIVDDNFIGNRGHAKSIVEALIGWQAERNEPFSFFSQVSVNIGRDEEMIDLLTAANFNGVFVGVESPDEAALLQANKHQNIKNAPLEMLDMVRRNGLTVIGSFILGLDGESSEAWRSISDFVEASAMPIVMLNLMNAPPNTRLWDRLEKEGRLKKDYIFGKDLILFMNARPSRNENDLLRDYVRMVDYLYEPSRFMARAYRYVLGTRPTRRALGREQPVAISNRKSIRDPHAFYAQWKELTAFLTIAWRQGVLRPTRGQFWRQLLGVARRNPSRFKRYLVFFALYENQFDFRNMVLKEARSLGLPEDGAGKK